tara:strand:- start:501 stop:704 length:204 start_codon:yes stop_codon:yes gene_type:complete
MNEKTKALIESGKQLANSKGEKWFSIDGLEENDMTSVINKYKALEVSRNGIITLDVDGYKCYMAVTF